MPKKLKLLTTTIAASCLLVACGSENVGQSTSVSSSESITTSTEAIPQFDHGPFFPEYRTPFKTIDSLDGGTLIQSNRIADKFVLGYEVDPTLTKGDGSGVIDSPLGLVMFMGTNYSTALENMETPLQGGYRNGATNESGDTQLLTSILRFDSPASAKEVADKFHEISTTQGSLFSEYQEVLNDPSLINEDWVLTPTTINSPGTTLASEKQRADVNDDSVTVNNLVTFTTHNEFLLYTWGQNSSDTTDDLKVTASAYLKKQIPLLDSIQTFKTEAGYGNTDGFPQTDDHGLTRYAVGYVDGAPVPAPLGERSARGYASVDTQPENIMKAFDLAGIEHVGSYMTRVAQARNADSAELFQSAYSSFSTEEDYNTYDEPQNLPNTKCMHTDTYTGGHLECVMVYEDKVALGIQSFAVPYEASISSIDPNSPSTNTETESIPEDMFSPTNLEDAKKLLSQKMAAQYLIFENAKVNPEGSEPPRAESVDPNKDTTSPNTASTIPSATKEN